MNQSILDVATATAEGMARVESATDPAWATDALAAIKTICRHNKEFMCDDVWATGLRPAHNDKALGPVIVRASKLGYCTKTDRVKPCLRSHLNPRPIWRSNIFEGAVNATGS